MSNNPEKRLVKFVAKLIDYDQHSDVERRTAADLWQGFLREDIGIQLSSTMWDVVREQGWARNRAKPIALFLDDEELLTAQDPEFFDGPGSDGPEAKRRSLIESFRYFGRERDCVSLEELIPQTARVLRESALPLPEDVDEDNEGDLNQYVESVYSKIERRELRTPPGE